MPYLLRISLTTRSRRCTQPPQPPPPSACSITTLAQSDRSPCHFVSHPFHSAVVTSGLQRPPVAPQSRRILPSSSFAHAHPRRCTQPPQPMPPSACSITTLAQSGRSPCHFVSHPFHSAVVTSGLQRPPVTTQQRRVYDPEAVGLRVYWSHEMFAPDSFRGDRRRRSCQGHGPFPCGQPDTVPS